VDLKLVDGDGRWCRKGMEVEEAADLLV